MESKVAQLDESNATDLDSAAELKEALQAGRDGIGKRKDPFSYVSPKAGKSRFADAAAALLALAKTDNPFCEGPAQAAARLQCFQSELKGFLPFFAGDLAVVQFERGGGDLTWTISRDRQEILEISAEDYVYAANILGETVTADVHMTFLLSGIAMELSHPWLGFEKDRFQTPLAIALHDIGCAFDRRGVETLHALRVLVAPILGTQERWIGWVDQVTKALRPAVASRLERFFGRLRVSLAPHLPPPPLCRLVIAYVGAPDQEELRPTTKSSTQTKQERKKGAGAARRGGGGGRGRGRGPSPASRARGAGAGPAGSSAGAAGAGAAAAAAEAEADAGAETGGDGDAT